MHIIYYYHHRCGPRCPYMLFSNPGLICTDFCVSAVSRRDSFVLFRRTSHILLYYYSDIWTGKAYQTAWSLLFVDALLKLYHINYACLLCQSFCCILYRSLLAPWCISVSSGPDVQLIVIVFRSIHVMYNTCFVTTGHSNTHALAQYPIPDYRRYTYAIYCGYYNIISWKDVIIFRLYDVLLVAPVHIYIISVPTGPIGATKWLLKIRHFPCRQLIKKNIKSLMFLRDGYWIMK